MFACFKSFKRDTSLMAVQGAPSSCSNLISLRATSFPVILRERKVSDPSVVYNLRASSLENCSICTLLGYDTSIVNGNHKL